MAFEVIEAGQFARADPLPAGEVSISKNGILTAHAEDLTTVGIEHYAIILADKATFRIGLRSVRDGEEQKSMACCVIKRKNGGDTGKRTLNVKRAIRHISLTPEACAARYTLNIHHDEVVFVNLNEARTGGRKKGK